MSEQPETIQQVLGKVRSWARQTILFAIRVRDDVEFRSQSEEFQAKRALEQMDRVEPELFTQAHQDAGGNLMRMGLVFPELVLKWVHKELSPTFHPE